MDMRMKEEVMYLRVDTDEANEEEIDETIQEAQEAIDRTIQEAIDSLAREDKSLVGLFGSFRTELARSSNRLNTPPGVAGYIRVVVETASFKAYDALYARLGAVPLGG